MFRKHYDRFIKHCCGYDDVLYLNAICKSRSFGRLWGILFKYSVIGSICVNVNQSSCRNGNQLTVAICSGKVTQLVSQRILCCEFETAFFMAAKFPFQP